MRLTPINRDTLTRALAGFESYFALATPARAAFDLIAGSRAAFDAPYDTPAHRQAALDLVMSFGVPVIHEKPSTAFSWDGHAIRTQSEASVLVHELAHWQIAPPDRRHLPMGKLMDQDGSLALRADRVAVPAERRRRFFVNDRNAE